MKIQIIARLALMLMFFATGCGKPHDYSGVAGTAMLARQQAYRDATTEIPRGNNPVFQVSLPTFVAEMQKVDVSACPRDFRQAWNDYLALAQKSAQAGEGLGYTAMSGAGRLTHDGGIPLDHNGLKYETVSGELLDTADEYKPKPPDKKP